MSIAAGGPAGGSAAAGAAAAASRTAAAGAGAAVNSSGSKGKRAGAPQRRSIRFKHVRFNRVVVRVTWEGPPLSINNFGLVLDKKVYRNIAGGWKDVLNKCVSRSTESVAVACQQM